MKKMKKMKKRIALCMTICIALANIAGAVSGNMHMVHAGDGIKLQASVEARYSSNHIRWKPMVEATGYHVLRSEEALEIQVKTGYDSVAITWKPVKNADGYRVFRSANGETTEVTEEKLDGTTVSFQDRTVKDAVVYSYVVKAYTGTEEIAQSKSVTDHVKVGMDALKTYAALAKEFEGEDQIFNGERGVDVSESADLLHKVNTGSVILRFKADSSNTLGVLLGTKDASINLPANLGYGSDCTSMFLKNDNEMFRFVYRHTQAEIGGPYSFKDGDWHTIVLSCNPDGKYMRVTIDGVERWSNTVETNKGMFAKQNILDQVTIGAQKNPDGTIAYGFKGAISQVIVTDEILSDEAAIEISRNGYSGKDKPGMNISEMFNTAYGDNSWVFTGGSAVQGGYAQTQGIRNYIGQFEEYVRWTNSINENGRQRYTINTGRSGRTLSDVASAYDKLVTAFGPKAAVYMIGEEDYSQGDENIAQFKKDLKVFIDKSLDLKENNGGFAVIQKPFAVKNDSSNTMIRKYCGAVDEVVGEYQNEHEKYNRIVVVDHFTKTNTEDFKTNKLQEDGSLNARGHFEIGKQFSEATYGSSNGYPGSGVTLNLEQVEQADSYLNVQPKITSTDSSLQVTIPDEYNMEWKYELNMEETIVSGNITGNTFEIPGLVEGKEYVLKMQSSDEKKQLVTMKGIIENGRHADQNVPVLDRKQQAITDMMDEKASMTWLFMGDSITHGALWTYGYDGIAQTFEKYLRDQLGRTEDVVVNTAVSGATTISTLNTIEQRLKKYMPDVVSIMLGTNDAANNADARTYKEKLQTIINKVKELNPHAVIILRSPTPVWNAGVRETNIAVCIEEMKEIAKENDLIYIDQYTKVQEAFTSYPWLKGAQYLFGNNIHPGVNGHLIMTRQFIKGCGLWTDDSKITNLFYKMPIAQEVNAVVPSLQSGANRIGVSVAQLKEESGLQIGQVTLKATTKDDAQSYAISIKDGEEYAILKDIPSERTYEVEVSAYLKNEAKKVVFAKQEIALKEDSEEMFDILLSNKKAKDLSVNAVIGNFSVSSMAPEGNYVFELCEGEGSNHNTLFDIEEGKLKIKGQLEEGNIYPIRVKAVCGKVSKEEKFEIYAVGKGLIFEKENQEISSGSPVDITTEAYAEKLLNLEEGTFIIQYTSTSNYIIQSLFSIANGSINNNNRHMHVYIRPEGTLGCEIRNDSALNYHILAANAVKAEYKGSPAKNTIALKADKENGQYKLFANGSLVATVDAATIGGFKFAQDITGLDTVQIGATKRGGTAAYPFGGMVHRISVYETALSDEELIEATAVTEFPELQQIFHKNDGTGANYYRIPSLLTLKSGNMISAIDARFGGTHDSPNNIDIAVSRSEDGGKEWSEPFLAFHYDDFEDNTLEIPLGTQVRVNQSASFIDPVLLQDEETERVFLIADAMPAGYGSPQAVSGSGYKEINGQKYLKLQKAGETDYNYTVRENNIIYDDRTNEATEYSLNANFEILKNNELQTVKQKASRYDPTGTSGALVVDTTNKDVAMNIMYENAIFKVLPTTWLYMKYSDDDGKTWSDPVFLNGMVKPENSRVLVVGPGRGIQIKNGSYKGRLIIPVYDTSKSGIIYSDDHGITWTYAQGPNTSSAAMSETQIVEMPDGSLKVYARSNNSKIASAASIDGGETWSAAQYVEGLTQPGWGSQLSVIRYDGLIDGKPAVIMSSPAGVGNYRRDGRVKIGLITDTNEEGIAKYQVEWKYDYSVDGQNVGFAYSCLTELPNHNIGLLYEKYDSYNPAELHSQDTIKYEELTLSDLMGAKAVRVTTAVSGNGSVSKSNTAFAGTKITVLAIPDKGYRLAGWISESGDVVHTELTYTFTAADDITLTAVFEKDPEETEIGKKELEALILEIERKDLDEYTEESVNTLLKTVKVGREVLAMEECSQGMMEITLNMIRAALNGLTKKPSEMKPANKTALQEAIAFVEAEDLSIYTDESVEILRKALDAAYAVIEDEELGEDDQAIVDRVKDTLRAAFETLVLKETKNVDKGGLKKLIDKSVQFDSAKDLYTEESFAKFKTAYDEAIRVYQDENATQEEVDASRANLETGRRELREKPNKDKLEELLGKIAKMNLGLYTEVTSQAVKAAYQEAITVFEDENATQLQVAQAVAKLQNAAKGLKKAAKEPEKTVKESEKATRAVKTGDDTTRVLWLTLIFLAVLESMKTGKGLLNKVSKR